LKKIGQGTNDPGNPRSLLAAEAQTHLQDAYWLLLHAQRPDGSIGYWKSTRSDVPLTAYFLRFLAGASEFIEVDAGAVSRARAFLWQCRRKAARGWLSIGDPVKKSRVRSERLCRTRTGYNSDARQ